MFQRDAVRSKSIFIFGLICFLSLVLSLFPHTVAQAADTNVTPPTVSSSNNSQPHALSGLKNTLMLGIGSDMSSASENWLKTTAPWDLRYQYLAGNVNDPNGNWAAWNSPAGQFATYYMQDSAALNVIPIFTYYCIISSGGDEYTSLNTATTMKNYFANFKLLMDKAAQFGKTVIVHVEPDFWGFMEQRAINNSGSADATKISATVASSGYGDVVSGLPNNLAGFAQALVALRNKYAPNVLLAYHDSAWGTKSTLGVSTDPNLNVQQVAQTSANFFNSLNANFDLIFNDITDRDAAYYQFVENDGGAHWWDTTNQKYPNFNQYASYLSGLHQQTQKPIMLWQLPIGNTVMRSVNNTTNHYQDNRVQYFLGSNYQQNLSAYVNAGVIGLLFGGGSGDVTDFLDYANDGVTNPSPIDGNNTQTTVSDDDGGYLRQQAANYYKNPVTLPGTTPPAPGCTANCSNTYNLPLVAYQANNTTTYLTVQNTSNNTANITIQYYNSSTGSGLSQDTIQLAPHGQSAFLPHVSSGQTATGIVSSDQTLNVLVSEAVGTGGSAFNVSSQTGSTLYAPIASNGYLGFNTALTVFNPSSSPTSVTIQFYDGSGNQVSAATKTLTLAAHASQVVNQQGSALGNSQLYWAQISGGSGANLVAQVTETNAAINFTATFNASSQLGTSLYAPAVFNNAFAFYTGMAFANPNTSAANITITYYGVDGSTSFTQNATIPANGTWSVFQGGLAGLPAGFNGSAQVTSSQPIVAVVNENGGGSKSGTYTMLASGGQNVGLPVMASGAYGGYYTGTTVQNLSGSVVTVTFQYLNGDGSNAGSKTYTIGGHASLQLYQGNTNSNSGLVLQSGFFGTAFISSSSANSLVATTNAVNGGLFYTYTEPIS